MGRAAARVERDLRPRRVGARRHALPGPPLGAKYIHLRPQVRVLMIIGYGDSSVIVTILQGYRLSQHPIFTVFKCILYQL